MTRAMHLAKRGLARTVAAAQQSYRCLFGLQLSAVKSEAEASNEMSDRACCEDDAELRYVDVGQALHSYNKFSRLTMLESISTIGSLE